MFEITHNQHHHLKYHNKQYMEYSCDTWIPIPIDEYLHDLLILIINPYELTLGFFFLL